MEASAQYIANDTRTFYPFHGRCNTAHVTRNEYVHSQVSLHAGTLFFPGMYIYRESYFSYTYILWWDNAERNLTEKDFGEETLLLILFLCCIPRQARLYIYSSFLQMVNELFAIGTCHALALDEQRLAHSQSTTTSVKSRHCPTNAASQNHRYNHVPRTRMHP